MQGTKGMFWSLFFISLGVLLLIQRTLSVDIPIARIFFGLFLIYIGVKIVFGSFGIEINRGKVNKISTSTEFVFSSGAFKLYEQDKTNKKFSTIFGNSTLDLTDLSKMATDDQIKVENIFSKTKIKTPSDYELNIKSNLVFGNIKVRGQKLGSFGDADFKTPNYSNSSKKLNLVIDSVFGEVEIE
jgi:predicted membrane protein